MTLQHSSDVYWRVYRCDDGTIKPVQMQWFDELHYTKERFMCDVRFTTELLAWGWIDVYKAYVQEAAKALVEQQMPR